MLLAAGIVRRFGGAVLGHPEVGVHAARSTGTRSASEVASSFQLAVAPASWNLLAAVDASDCWLDPVPVGVVFGSLQPAARVTLAKMASARM